jgi:hypothetical protein
LSSVLILAAKPTSTSKWGFQTRFHRISKRVEDNRYGFGGVFGCEGGIEIAGENISTGRRTNSEAS